MSVFSLCWCFQSKVSPSSALVYFWISSILWKRDTCNINKLKLNQAKSGYNADGKCSVWQQLQQHPVIWIQRVSHIPQRNIQPTCSIGKYTDRQGLTWFFRLSDPIITVSNELIPWNAVGRIFDSSLRTSKSSSPHLVKFHSFLCQANTKQFGDLFMCPCVCMVAVWSLPCVRPPKKRVHGNTVWYPWHSLS